MTRRLLRGLARALAILGLAAGALAAILAGFAAALFLEEPASIVGGAGALLAFALILAAAARLAERSRKDDE